MTNVAYWAGHPLYPGAVRVLRRIEGGRQKWFDDQFDVAYLVAQECVEADMEHEKLSLTDKGREALAYYREVL